MTAAPALWRARPQAEAAADKLRAFAHPQRLMILSLLLEGERSVTDIDAATGIGQPALSQQLAELRRAEMVRTRRQAKQVYYRLADDITELCVRSIEAVFGDGDRRRALMDVAAPAKAREPDALARTDGAAVFARPC